MTTPTRLRLGTRGSRLARWQAEHVAALLGRLAGGPAVELVEITTTGDRIQDVPLSSLSGQAFFTKEIEQALIDDRIDLAVHSMKDLATRFPDELALAAVLEREDPRDALLSRDDLDLDALPGGARVGTSSLRRRALLARWRPDLELAELRGNVPTRIDRLRAGDYDAIVLASAGLHRLGLEAEISALLPPHRFLPAIAQGALALQARAADEETLGWAGELDHRRTRLATTAERAMLRRVEGGCQAPVGALAVVEGTSLRLEGIVCSLDGRRSVDGSLAGPADRAAALGMELAERLLERGADNILAELRSADSEGSL